MEQEVIKITLPEGVVKKNVFETVALANGWTPNKIETVEKEVTVNSDEAQAKFEEFKANINGFGFLGAFKNDDGTETLKYTEQVEVKNIPAEVFGKQLLAKLVLGKYGEAKSKLAIQVDIEAISNKQKAVQEELANVELKVD